MKKTIISVIGKDAVGITAKVSAACGEHNVNIVDITQSVLQGMFVMVMQLTARLKIFRTVCVN